MSEEKDQPPKGTIDDFIARHAGKVKKPLTIEQMNEIAAAGWAGEFADDDGNASELASRAD